MGAVPVTGLVSMVFAYDTKVFVFEGTRVGVIEGAKAAWSFSMSCLTTSATFLGWAGFGAASGFVARSTAALAVGEFAVFWVSVTELFDPDRRTWVSYQGQARLPQGGCRRSVLKGDERVPFVVCYANLDAVWWILDSVEEDGGHFVERYEVLGAVDVWVHEGIGAVGVANVRPISSVATRVGWVCENGRDDAIDGESVIACFVHEFLFLVCCGERQDKSAIWEPLNNRRELVGAFIDFHDCFMHIFCGSGRRNSFNDELERVGVGPGRVQG